MAWHYDLHLTVFSTAHLKAIEEAKLPGPLGVHIKVDTGMHRIGIPWQEAPALLQAVAASPALRWHGLFTHMADGHTQATTLAQLTRWQHVLASLPPHGSAQRPPWIHVANSATLLCQGQHLQASGSTLVRFGLAAYGYEPALPHSQPVMGLKARITHVQTVPAGEGVSYGHTWVASQPSVIATLPLGYADGVPRGLSDTLKVSVHGQQVPQVGRITMDQLMIDVTQLPHVAVGDVVTLLETGANASLTLTPWAEALATIPYELLCGLRVRLPRSYERS
jgi:alanine racemase